NVTLSFFYDHQSAVNANDIRSLNNYGSIINDASPGLPGNGIPDALLVPNVLSEYIDENGVIVDVAVAGDPSYNNGVVTAFTNGGAPVPQPSRIVDNSFAFGQFAGPCATCFALEDWEILYPKSNRAGGAIGFDYDITSAIHYHFDGKYVESHIADNYQPAFSFFEYALDPDNAFITPQIQSALDAATLADPGAAFYVNRFLGDLGGRSEEITRSTWRIVNDFSGDIDTAFADLKWDLSYVNSQTQNRFVSHGDRILGNFFAAIDAVVDPSDNQIKCRVDVPSAWYPGYTPPDGMTDEPCVPYNLFGQQNSQAAIEYITYTALRKHTIGQEFFDGTLNFDTSKFFNLPGGPVGVAVGFEYREEESQNINDAFVKSGLAETAAQPDAVGGFHVSEGFVETYLPIVMHKPFMEELSLDLAGRWADYTPFGGTNAWKAGGVWAPFRDLSFRATYGRAVRAPNITEAFLPTTATFFGYSDPCDSDNINNDPDRDANCQALLGIGAGGFDAHDNITTQGSASGNVHLKPEESTSWTAGVILQPRWTPGLAITLDYYNIDIEDAISFVSAQSILNNCVDSPGGPDLAYCDLVDRDPTTHDVTFIRSQYVNASRLKTAGWDMTLTYRTPVDGLTSHLGPLRALDGDLNVNMTVNYTDDLRFFAFQDQPEDYSVYEGTIGDPEIKLLSRIAYRQGPLTVGWESRFMSKVTRFSRSPGRLGPESISPAYVEPQWYHDITAQFDVGSRYQVYGGVNNVFDEEPPLGIVQGDGSDASYDLIGRFVFVGFRAHY
ncbi:MAG TPA: TonB-dependent receptor, partial [Caulobacterales bacterium]|nr:TonB-dependent receptor [Caulobacterales bacterium]